MCGARLRRAASEGGTAAVVVAVRRSGRRLPDAVAVRVTIGPCCPGGDLPVALEIPQAPLPSR